MSFKLEVISQGISRQSGPKRGLQCLGFTHLLTVYNRGKRVRERERQRDVYHYIISIVQLLMSGCSIQGFGLRQS